MHHVVRLGRWPRITLQVVLNQAPKRLQVRHDGAKKKRLPTAGHQKRREVLHFNRVYQFRFIFYIHPGEASLGKFGLQLIKKRLVIAAGTAPLGA